MWAIAKAFLGKQTTNLILAAVFIAALFSYGFYKDSVGYDRAAAECELRVEKFKTAQLELLNAERKRQQNANNAAKKLEAELIKDIQTKTKDIDQLLLEQSIESIKDPNAGNACLGASSVRRINKIK